MWRKTSRRCQHDPGSRPHSRWQHGSLGGLALASEAATWRVASVRGCPGSSILGAHGCTLLRRVRRRDSRHLLSRATQSDGSLSTHGPKQSRAGLCCPLAEASSQPRALKCRLRVGVGVGVRDPRVGEHHTEFSHCRESAPSRSPSLSLGSQQPHLQAHWMVWVHEGLGL
jgi:hypothetical protein